jgi:SOS-response transcriptional repressor LexA
MSTLSSTPVETFFFKLEGDGMVDYDIFKDDTPIT